MIKHISISDREIRRKIRQKEISFGGNSRLKIYGLLNCVSGKRMNKANRVFFNSEPEAVLNGYRPCGHCLKDSYEKWKDGII